MTRSIISALHCFARTQQDTELDALCAEAKRGDEDAIAAINVAYHGGEDSYNYVCGAVWVLEGLVEGGRLTEDAVRGALMAVYENQGLDEIEIIPEPE